MTNTVNTSGTAEKLKNRAGNGQNNQKQGQQEQQGQQSQQQNNAPAKKSTMEYYLDQYQEQFKSALPAHIKTERFMRIALTAHKKMRDVTPESFLGALMTSAQMGLEPNSPLGEAYIIPYKNNNVLQAQFQLGYKGVLRMAYNTREYARIYAHEVYANDDFHYELGDPSRKRVHHIPADIPQGEPVFFYAAYEFKDGGGDFTVWHVNKVKHHAETYSKGINKSSSPWKKNKDTFMSMAKKTVLLDLLKYAPKSTTFAEAIGFDSTVRKDVTEEPDYIDMEMEDNEEMGW